MFKLVELSIASVRFLQSGTGSESVPVEATQLVTSSTEVRRSVIGLVALAVIVFVLGVLYWYRTGQMARDRYSREYENRHLAKAQRGTGRQHNRVELGEIEADPNGNSLVPELQQTSPPVITGSVTVGDAKRVENSGPRLATNLPAWGRKPTEPDWSSSEQRPPEREALRKSASEDEAAASHQSYLDAKPKQEPQDERAVIRLRRHLFGQ